MRLQSESVLKKTEKNLSNYKSKFKELKTENIELRK